MTDVILDITRLVGRKLKDRLPTGVDRVCLAYLEHFEHAQAFLHLRGQGILLTKENTVEIKNWLLADQVTGEHTDIKSQVETFAWRTRQLAKIMRSRTVKAPRHALFFNVGHSGLEYPRYMDWLHKNAVRPIYMVHDLIPITHPEYCRDGEVKRHTQRMNAMLHTAAGIITNSQDTLNQLSHYSDQKGLLLPPSIVAHLGVPPALVLMDKLRPLSSAYYVMLGTIEPRKNHLLILNVWRKLVERYGESTPKLVLIGQRGWECEQVVDMLERCPTLKDVVIEKPNVSDQELSTWLQHSEALLFPSFAEGFGLPLIEAIQQEITVMASDLPVFREIVGNIPHYFDPLDGLGWLTGIEAIWRGELAKNTTPSPSKASTQWSDHFQKIDTWITQV